MIQIKRAYEPPKKSDGYRVLVDRIWPRGKTKKALAIEEWAKGLAPSTPLRQFFGHDPKRWPDFQARYRTELSTNAESARKIKELAQLAGEKTVTLVYGAKDEQHNQAVVLRNLIARASHS